MNRHHFLTTLLALLLAACAHTPLETGDATYVTADSEARTTDVHDGYGYGDTDPASVIEYRSPGMRTLNSSTGGSY